MAIKEWSTNYPTSQDSPTTEQPTLSNTADATRVSQIHTLRDKLHDVATRLGDDGNLPAGSVHDIIALSSGDAQQVRFIERGADPTNVANKGFIYTKDASGVTELFYIDSGGNVRQLTPTAAPSSHGTDHNPGAADAATTAAPGATGVATASSEGSASSFARSDHVHQSNTTPADTTKAAAAIGTSGEPARADHKHDVTTAAAGAAAPGDSATEGSATTLARSDHTHSLPAYGSSASTFCEGNDSRLSDARPLATPVTAQASTPLALTSTDSGKVYTNEGASAEIVFNLPTAAADLNYTFIVQDANGIQINANTGDTIRVAASVSASAGLIETATVGNVVKLVAINATEWIAVSYVGTWTVT